ncbi:High-affinity glucose transporter [Colletotrichum gloeosporioides]|uniref:High-affinity glucose transporter n=1 Tax=Colletotrichum gloeosporioides TaxID=474922 RepID=A0A8H4CCI4_COLGL|nr:High-affinity glucose transporter [Colletotrichum gloeosporioides]KAF3801241.1 High-affinity glucose transporter [Colletotrichum gloeosporioides]
MADHQTSYNLAIILFATLGSLTYGYSTGIIATTLGQPTFREYFDLLDADSSAAITGGLNGLYQAGGLFGVLSTAWASDTYGRKMSIGFYSLVSVFGGALQAGSAHIGMLMVARAITGLGIGGLVISVPVWQSEVASPATRGFLVGLHGVFILIGYSLASWVGVAFYFVNIHGAQWRVPLAFQVLPPLALVLGIKWLPESPRWFIANNRHQEAMFILDKLHGNGAPESHGYVQEEFNAIRNRIEADSCHPTSWASLFKVPSYRKRLLVGFGTMFGAQCTGTQVINNYGPSLYSSMGFSEQNQLIVAAGWITFGVFCNYLNAKMLDWVGRRICMTIGMAGTSVALLGEAIMIHLYQGTENRAGNGAALAFLFLHLFFYGGFLDASTYVYASEIWPTHVRSKGAAASTSGMFVSSLVLLTVSPTAFDKIGWKYYMVLMSLTIIAGVCFAVFFPETKGKSLEEIGNIFKDDYSIVLEGDKAQNTLSDEPAVLKKT